MDISHGSRDTNCFYCHLFVGNSKRQDLNLLKGSMCRKEEELLFLRLFFGPLREKAERHQSLEAIVCLLLSFLFLFEKYIVPIYEVLNVGKNLLIVAAFI